jgi:hypothetical protein
MIRIRARKRYLSLAAVALLTAGWARCHAQEVDFENVPDQVRESIGLGPFSEKYDLDGSVNPFYLRGDFDGDGKTDYAFRIKSKADRSVGIAIWLSSLHRFVILGAGQPFKLSGSAATNLDFLNTWKVFGRQPAERGVGSGSPPHLLGEAILAGEREGASGLIYWNGKSFAWYQQGD